MTDDIRIEILFNSVEIELDRRWAMGEVPSVFTGRPAEHLRKVVKSWWNIYHEAISASTGKDRERWDRNPVYPSHSLETSALLSSLEEIEGLIRLHLPVLLQYRESPGGEEASLALLQVIANFYRQLKKQQTVP